MGVARELGGDHQPTASLSIEGFAHLAQDVRQASGREVLVADLELAGMPPLVYSQILERLTAQGYDVGKLRVTLQPAE